MVDLLRSIIFEQLDYDQKVKDRLIRKYPTKAQRLFAKAEAMQNEVAEIKQELKPSWNWWRNDAGTENEQELVIDDELRKKLAIEGIDVLKFLLSYFLELEVYPEELYRLYMEKHKIIHDRLKHDGNNGLA